MVASLKPASDDPLISQASQNRPAAMQLRNRHERKAPRRYVDELELAQEDEEGGLPQNTTMHLPKRGAYRGPVVEFNPDRSPAAFPTLDPRESNFTPDPSHAHQSHPLQHNSSARPSFPPLPQREQEPPFEAAQNMSNGHPRTHGFDPRLWREFRPPYPNDLDMIPFEGPEIFDTSNGPHNPVWRDNMRRIEEMNNMDEYEIEAANMATSDEEEDPTEKPPWDDIPLRLRLEMIASAAGEDNKIERALFRLKLTSAQFHAAAADYRRYLDEEDEDDANILRHQQLMHEALLNGHKAYSSPQGFQALAAVHLYKNVGRPEAGVKRPDIEIAKAYMTHCRLDAAFLDSYLAQPRRSTASFEPVAGPDNDSEDDTQPPPQGSVSQPIAIDDTRDPSTPPYPSTPVPPAPPNGTIPEISLTPVAQRHQTPIALSPVPLRLGTPVPTETVDRSPYFNRSSSRQSTNSTIEVEVDGKEPLQGVHANPMAANHNLENGNALPSSSSPLESQEAAPGATTQFPHMPQSLANLSNGTPLLPHHSSPERDPDPPPKRKRLNAPKRKSPAVAPPNGAPGGIQAPTHGSQAHRTNGAATNLEESLLSMVSAHQPASIMPIEAGGGPMEPLASSTTEEREQWAQRNGYGVEAGRGFGNGMTNTIGTTVGSTMNDGSAVELGHGENATGNGDKVVANGHGDDNGNKKGKDTGTKMTKKKPARGRKPKA